MKNEKIAKIMFEEYKKCEQFINTHAKYKEFADAYRWDMKREAIWELYFEIFDKNIYTAMDEAKEKEQNNDKKD